MTSVFVGDLPSDVTEDDLYSKFSQIGAILSVKVLRDVECRKRSIYGYILYQDPDHAKRAVEMFDNDVIQDQRISVQLAENSGYGSIMECNVFVKNLDRSVDSNTLYQAFSPYGRILSCKVPHRKKGSKCHGFVQFESELAANTAINQMNGSILFGKKIHVGHFLNRDQRESTSEAPTTSSSNSSSLRTVYIKNLSPSVDSVFLKITCSPYGDVSNVKIIRDTDGTSKGFAFVTFKKVEEALKAIEVLNGKQIDGRILFAGPAIKKTSRKNQHQLQQKQQIQNFHQESRGTTQQASDQLEAKPCIVLEPNQLTQFHSDIVQPTSILPAMSTPRQLLTQQYFHFLPNTLSSSLSFVQLPVLVTNHPEHVDTNCTPSLPQISQQNAVLYHSVANEAVPEASLITIREDDEIDGQTSGDSEQQIPLSDHHQQAVSQDLRVKQTPQQQAQGSPAPNTAQGVNLYVKHLDDDVDDVTLKGMFSKFGEVISAKVMMEGEKSRGFGFVCFARAEDAARATRDMRKRVDDVNRKPLYVAPAQRKEERQAFFREKLKSRQNELHQCDIETVQKCLTRMENPKENITQSLQIPAGDTTKTNSVNEAVENKHLYLLRTSQQSENNCREPPCFHSIKFHGLFRSSQKRSNFYNFECFNVENLRTPLIKPTRLSNLDEKSVDSWYPINVTGDNDFIHRSSTLLNGSNSVLSPKFPELHVDTVGSRKLHDSFWTCNEGSDVKTHELDNGLKKLGPIGCKPSTSDCLCDKSASEKPRPNQNLSFRLRPFNKLVPMCLDTKYTIDTSQLQKETRSCLLENLFYLSGQSDNDSEELVVSKVLPDLDTVYKASPRSKITKPEHTVSPTRTVVLDDVSSPAKSPVFVDPNTFSVTENCPVYPNKHTARTENHLCDPIECLRLRTPSLSVEANACRMSLQIRRHRDTTYIGDDDVIWRARCRDTPSPTNQSKRESPTVLGEDIIDLSTMSSWTVEQQKQLLSRPLRTRLTDVLAKILSSSENTTLWNSDLTIIIQELLRKKWEVNSLGEKIVNMILKMDVREILNLLQSKEHIISMVSESLKQIEHLDKMGTYLPSMNYTPDINQSELARMDQVTLNNNE